MFNSLKKEAVVQKRDDRWRAIEIEVNYEEDNTNKIFGGFH